MDTQFIATDRKSRLQEFVDWAAAHISGDEKGETQIFLDRLFQAFAQKGLLEIGKAEFRIRKAKEDGGGTAFADFVWKPLVLIEMKKRGTDLSRHYGLADVRVRRRNGLCRIKCLDSWQLADGRLPQFWCG